MSADASPAPVTAPVTAPETAMVLAAGLGKRMRPLTDDRPNRWSRASGRTLIDRTLDRLSESGVRRAVVNLHYLPDMLRAHLRDRDEPEVAFSDETDRLMDTGGGIVRALPQLGAAPLYCDQQR